MNPKISSNARKWLSLITAILLYYIIHEGSHLIVALIYGVFQEIRIIGLGVQVVANTELLSDIQIAIFCIVGSISTLLVACFLLANTKKIVKSKNNLLKAMCYYTTLGFMLLDPIYLSVLFQFVGGGDMNGILLIGIPEIIVQLFFGIIAIVNIYIIIKKVYPLYKDSFKNN